MQCNPEIYWLVKLPNCLLNLKINALLVQQCSLSRTVGALDLTVCELNEAAHDRSAIFNLPIADLSHSTYLCLVKFNFQPVPLRSESTKVGKTDERTRKKEKRRRKKTKKRTTSSRASTKRNEFAYSKYNGKNVVHLCHVCASSLFLFWLFFLPCQSNGI